MSGPENPLAFPSRRDEPLPNGGAYRNDSLGMTLRDWFAGQALAGLSHHIGPRSQDFERLAKAAYARADAMLAEREKADQR